jgi:uncharacterized damage-inducible protein DinB
MFSKMSDYLAWANGRSLASIESLDGPGDHLRGLLGHVLAAEENWFAQLAGRTAELESWPQLDVGQLRSHIQRNAETCQSILGSSGGVGGIGTTERIIRSTNARGETVETRASDILMHVFAHGAYHRGQIAASVKRLGGQPAVTDYIAFCRGA